MNLLPPRPWEKIKTGKLLSPPEKLLDVGSVGLVPFMAGRDAEVWRDVDVPAKGGSKRAEHLFSPMIQSERFSREK